jgi:hypothetical protein
MLADQGHACLVCGDPDPTDVDHCHATNRVRGILCGLCNRALGQAKDSPARLRALAAYLERT